MKKATGVEILYYTGSRYTNTFDIGRRHLTDRVLKIRTEVKEKTWI